MMSSKDDMIDTNEMKTSHLQSSFKNPKEMNHYVSDCDLLEQEETSSTTVRWK